MFVPSGRLCTAGTTGFANSVLSYANAYNLDFYEEEAIDGVFRKVSAEVC